MSQTPKTENQFKVWIDGEEFCYADFARELELENARMREALEGLAYWSRRKTETRITLRNRIAAVLDNNPVEPFAPRE
jgi:hypothetical protein